MASPGSVPSSPSQPTPAWLRGFWIALPVAAAGLVVALTSRQAPGSREAPPRLGVLPEFTLTDAARHPVTLASLRGRPWVADFIFTRCPGVCPGMTARLGRLRREIDPRVTFVSFTVDPEHDTPEVLARYAAGFGAPEGWLFVTGPAADVYGLSVNGFKLAAEAVPPGTAPDSGPFLHSSKFVLVDASGQVRGYYDSGDEREIAALKEDLDRVLTEGP
jgi:protein SCO1